MNDEQVGELLAGRAGNEKRIEKQIRVLKGESVDLGTLVLGGPGATSTAVLGPTPSTSTPQALPSSRPPTPIPENSGDQTAMRGGTPDQEQQKKQPTPHTTTQAGSLHQGPPPGYERAPRGCKGGGRGQGQGRDGPSKHVTVSK